MVMHRPENIKMLEEKENDSVSIMLKRGLVIEFRLINCIGDNFGVIGIVV